MSLSSAAAPSSRDSTAALDPSVCIAEVGRCELFQPIATGGMAIVYLGRWRGARDFCRLVAVKAMRRELADNLEVAQMFEDEARLVSRIRHPHVISTLDLIDDQGELYIVMDYAVGANLAELVPARPSANVPPPIALRIVHDVLLGLQAAHEAVDVEGEPLRVVHRDVTPHNIHIGVDGFARLLDFGIAHATQRGIRFTEPGLLKGKIRFMAPEQLDQKALTARTDVYAASAVLWQLLSGRRLLAGCSQAQMIYRIMRGDIPDLSTLRPHLGKAIHNLVRRGLSVDPAARWSSAEAMARSLERSGDLASRHDVGKWLRRTVPERLAREEALARAIDRAPLAPPSAEVSTVSARPTFSKVRRSSVPTLVPAVEPVRTESSDDALGFPWSTPIAADEDITSISPTSRPAPPLLSAPPRALGPMEKVTVVVAAMALVLGIVFGLLF
ncbi:MAG: serine/threonine-protein kinase [Myxococcota bacterium]